MGVLLSDFGSGMSLPTIANVWHRRVYGFCKPGD